MITEQRCHPERSEVPAFPPQQQNNGCPTLRKEREGWAAHPQDVRQGRGNLDIPFDSEYTPGAHNAVQVCLRVQPSEKVCVITVLTTAATRPSQSNTGAPEAPWSIASRSSPSNISRRAVPASLPSVTYCTNRPPTERRFSPGYATATIRSSGMSGDIRIATLGAAVMAVSNSSTTSFSAWAPAERCTRTEIDRTLPSCSSLKSFQPWAESSIAAATCSTVTIVVGE